ncbi:MAG: TonB family protein [Blastocatellia bacterium]|nr:TonB family protein [Blastocatellia bacterium]
MAQEEFVRRTRPIASTPIAEAVAPPVESRIESIESTDAPAVEVVPITNPFPPREAAAKDPGAMAYRRTEPIATPPPAAPRQAPQAPVPQAPVQQAPPQPRVPASAPPPRPQRAPETVAQPAQSRHTAPQSANTAFHQAPPQAQPARFAAADDLSFSIPEADSLVSRLFAGLKNIGEAFKSGGPVKQNAAGEFQFLLPEESLVSRIGREVGGAWAEFRQNPSQFLSEFVRGEGSNRFRRNAMLAGSEMALVGFVTIFFVSVALSPVRKVNPLWLNAAFIGGAVYLVACYLTRGFLLYKLVGRVTNKLAVPKFALEIANWTPVLVVFLLLGLFSNYNFFCILFPNKCGEVVEEQEEPPLDITMVDLKMDMKLEESRKAKEKSLGGSKAKPQKASGGGGGGRQQPTPPSKGVPPQMALTPQIIPPNPEPPKIKNPSLVVASTIYGDPKAIPQMKGPIGDPTGVPAPPSSGPGTGAGIGRGSGSGVGGGEGGGLGPGRGGNVGGGDMGLGGGGGVQPMSASLRPTILYKEKAKYTEEARQNKIQGTVVLNVVFTAGGSIENIRVVRGLPDGLTEKAIEAAKRIRFQPAVKNGSPVSVRGNLEFTFNLY